MNRQASDLARSRVQRPEGAPVRDERRGLRAVVVVKRRDDRKDHRVLWVLDLASAW